MNTTQNDFGGFKFAVVRSSKMLGETLLLLTDDALSQGWFVRSQVMGIKNMDWCVRTETRGNTTVAVIYKI